MHQISQPARSAIQAHVLAAYPAEACGLLFAGPSGQRFVAMENLADRLHALDPEAHPRTARDAFAMNEAKVAREVRQAEAAGETWAAIVHSHIDCGAYFSSEDIRNAAPEGECIYPALTQVVVDVRAWGIEEACSFHWDAAHRAFIPAGHDPAFKCAR